MRGTVLIAGALAAAALGATTQRPAGTAQAPPPRVIVYKTPT